MIDFCTIFSTSGVILFNKLFDERSNLEFIREYISKFLNNISEHENKHKFKESMFKYKYLPKEEIIILVSFNEFFEENKIEQIIKLIEKNWRVKIHNEIKKENNFFIEIPDFEKYLSKILKIVSGKNIFNKNKTNEDVKEKENNTISECSTDKPKNEIGKNIEKVDLTENNEKESEENIDKSPKNYKETYDPNSDFVVIDDYSCSNSKKSTSKNKKSKKGKKNKNKNKKNNIDDLNYSEKNNSVNLNNSRNYIDMDENDKEDDVDISLVSEDEVKNEDEKSNKTSMKSMILNQFKSKLNFLTVNKELNDANLEPILEEFMNQLIKKNVSQEISKKICDNLKFNLLEKFKGEKRSISTFVKESLMSSLRNILTPENANEELIPSIINHKAKNDNNPYVIVFIGVNGVGKSTNLAKVAHMLKKNKFSILIAACDTFRSGAIQQLQVHGNNLDIPIYERGQKEDPSLIAYNAIKEAKKKKIDVVLIDTAGRMQDNEPLMKALSKIVNINKPNRILFIGEAISGNDIIDQLTKFNLVIKNNSPQNNVREIDGIILTKFDTVDEKVGVALSLTYTSKKPIVFIGNGQKYFNLKKFNIESVINMLLKTN